MTLRIQIQTRKVIDVQDWDNLVQETYGRAYSFQQQDGCKPRQHCRITVPDGEPYDYENDTVPEIVNGKQKGVSFAAWLARDPKQLLNRPERFPDMAEFSRNLWWDRNFYPDVSMVINDLHAKGLLPEGEYDINIDW